MPTFVLRQIETDILDRARQKAVADGRSFDMVLRTLIEMYGNGEIALPEWTAGKSGNK